MRGKLIVIEGTDCSGKETQTNLICEKFKKEGIKIMKFSFPDYDTPTGKIIGGPYLGKLQICDSFFKEDALNLDPKIASLYYIADRMYNISKIKKYLEEDYNIILDRYSYSNMAYQGGKFIDPLEREKMYEWLERLEFGFCELPIPDIRIFLHMPFEAVEILRKNRKELADRYEQDDEHLKKAEQAYMEISKKYNFHIVHCTNKNNIRSIEDINLELCDYLSFFIKPDKIENK